VNREPLKKIRKEAGEGEEGSQRPGPAHFFTLVAVSISFQRPGTGGKDVLVYLRESRFRGGLGVFSRARPETGNRGGPRGKSFPPGGGAGGNAPLPAGGLRAAPLAAGRLAGAVLFSVEPVVKEGERL